MSSRHSLPPYIILSPKRRCLDVMQFVCNKINSVQHLDQLQDTLTDKIQQEAWHVGFGIHPFMKLCYFCWIYKSRWSADFMAHRHCIATSFGQHSKYTANCFFQTNKKILLITDSNYWEWLLHFLKISCKDQCWEPYSLTGKITVVLKKTLILFSTKVFFF